MWTYSQRTGELSHDGLHVAFGYSGSGDGHNNPDRQEVSNVGPIPRGLWTLGPIATDYATGPHSILLQPQPMTQTFGRGRFRVHGDSREHPGCASHGCIVLDPFTRGRLTETTDRTLEVL
jgi:hypothetical protein